MKNIILVILFLIYACDNNKNDKEFNYKNDISIQNTDQQNYKKPIVYFFENDTIKQKVEIVFFEKKLLFKIVSENRKSKSLNSIKGDAILKNYSEMEFEEDNEGNAIPVDEYIYENNNCWISIKIENENHDFIKLSEADCNIFNISNNLNTNFYLKRM